MAAIGLSHYNIRVPSEKLEEIRRFYSKIVGLVEGPRPPFKSIGYWLYAGDVAILHLSESRQGEAPAVTTSSTLDHVAIACTDFDAMRRTLDEHGIAYTSTVVPGLNVRQLFLQDPAGNGVELIFP